MELVCVRHGRTAWNADRRFQGHTDVPLDGEGRAQAAGLAAHLRGEHFDVALTSDLVRAAATAEMICAGRAVVLERDPELREMNFGAWEGLTWDQIVARWPEINAGNEKTPRHYTAEGGESFEEVTLRAARVLDRIAGRLAPDGRALVVSHAGVMHALVRVLLGPAREESLGLRFVTASVMRAAGSPGEGWRLTAFNEVPAGRTDEVPR
jgi:broad specificity phosphatase PhoE